MTYTYLSDDQAARAKALDVAHRLLSASNHKGPLTASSRDGLLDSELLPAIRVAEYVLTGKWTLLPRQLEDSTAGASVYLDRAEQAEAERDGWKAKHAALRADVDRLQREHKALPAMWDFVDALGHDAARDPQSDPDTTSSAGAENYAKLGKWCKARGLVTDAERGEA